MMFSYLYDVRLHDVCSTVCCLSPYMISSHLYSTCIVFAFFKMSVYLYDGVLP
jgi:hypothetical protein